MAVSENPIGPFRDAKGAALITGEMTSEAEEFVNIDPAVLVDDDGQAHLFWGRLQCFHARLRENMIEFDGEIERVEFPGFCRGLAPAQARRVVLLLLWVRNAGESRLRDEPQH